MEQALVLISIVLGVAITFELENLHCLVRAPNVRWHWAQPVFAFFALMIVLVFWWMMANRGGDGSTISLGEFLPIMGLMVTIVLIAAVALPDKLPGESETLDLAEYYMANRRYQWSLVLIVVLAIGSSWLATLVTRYGFFHGLIRGWGEWLPMLLVTWMIFANRWWKVGVGYAAMSFIPIAWLSRRL